MPSVCIFSPAHGRAALTDLVLAQRGRLAAELAGEGVDVCSLIAADDENLDVARLHGAATLEFPNAPLGAKCSAGLRAAARLAEHVVWIGSDDWIHPDALRVLPGDGATVVHGWELVVVDMARGTMVKARSLSEYGVIPWIIDGALIRGGLLDPIRPDLMSGLDGELIRGLRANGRAPLKFRKHDPHPFRCVDFKTRENITPYSWMDRQCELSPEDDAWATLAGWYPADLVARARALAAEPRRPACP